MKLRSLALVLVSLFGASPAQAQHREWYKVAPVGGGFSVMMPARPKEEIKTTADLTLHIFSLTTQDNLYLVSYGDYAPRVVLQPESELDASRDGFLRAFNAKLLETKRIKVEGRTGIEFTAMTDRAAIKSRIFLFGNRIHQIAVAALNATTDTDEVKRFFSSFALERQSRP